MADAVARAKELLKQSAIAANRVSLHPADVTAICTALIAETERAERLHAALRLHAIDRPGPRFARCNACTHVWDPEGRYDESHDAGCLAAPLAEEGTK